MSQVSREPAEFFAFQTVLPLWVLLSLLLPVSLSWDPTNKKWLWHRGCGWSPAPSPHQSKKLNPTHTHTAAEYHEIQMEHYWHHDDGIFNLNLKLSTFTVWVVMILWVTDIVNLDSYLDNLGDELRHTGTDFCDGLMSEHIWVSQN